MGKIKAKATLKSGKKKFTFYRLEALSKYGKIEKLPYSIRVLLENLLRNIDKKTVTEEDVKSLAKYNAKKVKKEEIAYRPARVLLQDFTGVPLVVDLAAMRDAMKKLGGKPKQINPVVPVDLVVDHSVQVDAFNSGMAFQINADKEFERNRERYEFLHWGKEAFDNFRVVPPATGICHQVNLEYLGKCVLTSKSAAYPDTLVGTDSHTTMINAIGVLGWGVGGIEAEAAMLGQPVYMLTPEVIGFKLTGKLLDGVTGTDLVLTVTQMLRNKGVVDKFVEFFGPALDHLPVPARAMISNMAPEYGATCGFFPIDSHTLEYLKLTGRSEEQIRLVEDYCREQMLFRTSDSPEPDFTDTLELDISQVEPSLAGPKRPQDRVALSNMKQEFLASLTKPLKDRGYELKQTDIENRVVIQNGDNSQVGHGAVVIAAITSCTNTSDPQVLIAAGLLAKKAIEKGLTSKPYVKTSMAPGSRVVIDYLTKAGLLDKLEKLGFYNVGFGCTTCIGNSGPLPEPVEKAIVEGNLVAASVLSGNRNFEGRINQLTKANFLASPPLVVAYAIAGRTDIDLTTEPLGTGSNGEPVYLKDIWPTQKEIQEKITQSVSPKMFQERYSAVFSGNPTWDAIPTKGGARYDWEDNSTYIQNPPYFEELSKKKPQLKPFKNARVLGMFGDSITTDHISPAGAIKKDSPAGKYLMEHGVKPEDFNSYGSRRGNDRVMTRGTFANVRLRNLLAPGTEGGVTVHLPSGKQMSIYDAAMKYKQEDTPLIVLAGKDYGMGSSRDWAAKGTFLLGVKAVIAESYERIHRSNLVFMGVLPLEFMPGENRESLGLTGHEIFTIDGLTNKLKPKQKLTVRAVSSSNAGASGVTLSLSKGAVSKSGTKPLEEITWENEGGSVKPKNKSFKVIARIDTPIEVEYYLNGGILQTVLREMAKK